MVLASTLARKYNATPVGIYSDDWDTVPCHVGVLLPNGLYGDARGLNLTADQFLDGFEKGKGEEIKPIAQGDMHRIWGHRISVWDAPSEDLDALGFK